MAVEVDAQQLTLEAENIAAASPDPVPASAPESAGTDTVNGAPELPAGPAIDPAIKAGQVQPVVTAAVHGLCNLIAPNWEVTKAEAEPVGESLSLVLAYWMPDSELHPKYMALMSLGMSLWSVAAARRDPDTGEFKALRAVKQKPQAKPAPAPAPAPQGLTL